MFAHSPKTAHLLLSMMIFSLGAVGCGSTSSSTGGFLSGSGTSASSPAASSSPVAARNLIVYASQGKLIQVDRQGANPRALTSGFEDSDPFFEPSGKNLVFCRRSPSGKQDIYRSAPDGSNPVNLTGKLTFDCFAPYYAWDGSFIVFSGRFADGDRDLYRMNPDGSDVRHLTQGVEIDSEPAFSPDGREVVFERATAGGKSKICRLDLADGKVTDLTTGTFSDRLPSFCPPADQNFLPVHPQSAQAVQCPGCQYAKCRAGPGWQAVGSGQAG